MGAVLNDLLVQLRGRLKGSDAPFAEASLEIGLLLFAADQREAEAQFLLAGDFEK